nr:MAG TPA: hypothetical protein [Caudoviricetes sp.]
MSKPFPTRVGIYQSRNIKLTITVPFCSGVAR